MFLKDGFIEKARKEIFLAFLFFLSALCVWWISHSLTAAAGIINRPRELVPPPPYLERMSFGFQETLADLLWVRAIQDFDYCESLGERAELSVSVGANESRQPNRCVGQGWLYQMLNTIMNLSPHFRAPAATGGLALTVLVNDSAGASKIFDRAVAAFPEDWPILYRASYQALLEEKNKVKAAQLLERAAKAGGPQWLYQLASRLYSEEGQKMMLEQLYVEAVAADIPEAMLNVIKQRLQLDR